MDTPKLHSFVLTVRECELHEVIVEAPDIETAVDIAHRRWANGELGVGDSGYVVVLDEAGDELDEIASW